MRRGEREIGAPERRYEILESEYARTEIKERMHRLLENVHEQGVDTLLFLDRSARPLSWMFREAWKLKYPDEQVPDVKFANVGTSNHINEGHGDSLKKVNLNNTEFDNHQDLLWKSESDGRWIESKDIPRVWRDAIGEQPEVVDEIRSIYKKELADKAVLIVDELAASGKTQAIALETFRQAFPDSIWQATTFFKSEGNWYPERDQEKLPWFRVEGMAGVVELPESEYLSSTLNQEHVDVIQAKLQREIDQLVSEALDLVKPFRELLQSAGDFISELQDGEDVKDEQIQALQKIIVHLVHLERLYDRFQHEGTLESFDEQTNAQTWRGFYDAISDQSLGQLDPESLERLRRIRNQVRGESPYSNKLSYAKTIAKVRDQYDDVDDLKRKSKKLRDELKKLAKDLVKNPPGEDGFYPIQN